MLTEKLTQKQRVMQAILRQEVDRVPWIPFVGCHAGFLIGKTANEYLKSEELIVQGLNRAIERYQPDGIPVVFDLQIEAETLGCELAWADDNPPAVIQHPLADGVDLDQLAVPTPDMGRIKTAISATRQLRKQHPDLAIYGLITGPFTLSLHLLGTDIFMKMFDDDEYVSRLMSFCRDVAIAMSTYYIEAGCDVIAVVDPMTSQIGPDQFQQFVSPYITPVFEHIRVKEALSSFFVCGHAEQNVPVMCECGCDNISIDENIALEYVRTVCEEKGVSFGGNLQLTTVLLLGKPLDAQKNAVACLKVAGEKGFLLAPGCDLPYATPPENLESIFEVVNDPYQRDVIMAIEQENGEEVRLNMNEYGQYRKVVVDIITLDSEACAPCQYMVSAVRKIAPQFEGIVEWREHKIKYRESLIFMTSLMVQNVPTICIDGKITFVSRIPSRDELIETIQKRINEKYRVKIQQRKGALYVLGPDNEPTRQVRKNIEQAITELASDIEVKMISDEEEMRENGVLPEQAPAVMLARYQIKSSMTIPEVSIIREWIKDI